MEINQSGKDDRQLARLPNGEIDYDDQTPAGYGNHPDYRVPVADNRAAEVDRALGLETISVRLTTIECRELTQEAKKLGVSVSALIRRKLTLPLKPIDAHF